MRWVLIRHGMTRGNLQRRYIGARTDEPLCEAGIRALRAHAYPPVAKVFVSPMKRCVQTAAMLYPGVAAEAIEAFRECDFGLFEGKSYQELNGRADYQAWVDAAGELPFPQGEGRAQFARRCTDAFAMLWARERTQDCALIAHGGTIMAIMEAYATPKGGYYDFQVKNGEGYILSGDGSYEIIGR